MNAKTTLRRYSGADTPIIPSEEDEIIESVIGFDALFGSMLKCKKGVIWKGSTASFYLNGIVRTLNLCDDLKEGTYKPGKPVKFTITHPKKRDIVSIGFRDRVYQRSLNDNYIYPEVVKHLIPENAACQKGKGTDYARNLMIRDLREMYKEFGTNFWILQCDIRGYYPNMPHEVAEETFRAMLPDKRILEMALRVLSGQYSGDKGYNPGSQMVQIVGISALHDIDVFIKEETGARHYIRYMDDFILIHESAEHLRKCREALAEMLKNKGFELHEKKTRIYPAAKGIRFLGFDFRVTETGKVLMIRKPEAVKSERRKLRKLVNLAREGKIPVSKVYEHYKVWRSCADKGNNHRMVMRMDQYFKNLMEGKNDDGNVKESARCEKSGETVCQSGRGSEINPRDGKPDR